VNFCGVCGGSLASESSEAERRQLSVLFSDLVGFTELSHRLDPEELGEVVGEYQRICARAIVSLDGHIAQYLGDGVLAYFGHPNAHEDDACRAVNAGLQIVSDVSSGDFNGQKLHVRVGIHTGLVVVGEIGGAQQHKSPAMGETLTVAARVQAEAEPDTVLITHATRRHVSGFYELESLPPRPLKGISRGVPLYRVLEASGADSKLDAAAVSGLTAFVGREDEVRLVREKWDQARLGSKQIVEVRGEAGIGKSRLVRFMRTNLTGPEDRFIECRCSPHHQGSALYPLTEMLERQIQLDRTDSDRRKYQKIRGFLDRLEYDNALALPLIGALLGIPSDHGLPEMAPQKQRQLTLEVLTALLSALARKQPLLLAIEDLHWADPSTLEFVERLVRADGNERLLACLTYRPEFYPSWDPGSHRVVMHLSRLHREHSESVLRAVAENKSLPREVIDGVLARAEGVPLYVEEITKTVLESDLLKELEDRFELTGALPGDFVPPTLAESLAARLDRLKEAKPVAQLAAVIGREFSYELLHAISPLPEAALRGALTQLKEAELLFQRGQPPRAVYIFKHALVRDAAYNLLLRTTRQRYHKQIAETLREGLSELAELQPEVLAGHFDRAGMKEEAVRYWQRAGTRALGCAANREAIVHLAAAIDALSTLPENRARLETELDLQLSLMGGAMAVWGWASKEVEAPCVRARELSIALNDEQQLLAALWGLWTVQFLRGHVQPAMDVAVEVLERSKHTSIKMFKVLGQHAMTLTPLYQGNPRACIEHSTAALALLEDDRDTEWQIINAFQLATSVVALTFRSAALWMLGKQEESRRELDRCFELTAELNHPPTTAYAKTYSLYFYHFWREPDLVHQQAKEAFELADREGFVMWRGMAMVFLGFSRFERGEKEEGLNLTRRGLDDMFAVGNKIIFVQNMALYGEMLWRAGRADEARDTLEEGIRWADQHDEHFMESELFRLRGEIRFERGDEAGALSDFERAIELCRKQEALTLELRATLSKSRLERIQGKTGQARRPVAALVERFDEGLERYDLEEARAFLGDPEAATEAAT
jgi:class 3 adenylate cyclase/tetratricopeptide (TPR) repeat protein